MRGLGIDVELRLESGPDETERATIAKVETPSPTLPTRGRET
jgi:hypothetical protein